MWCSHKLLPNNDHLTTKKQSWLHDRAIHIAVLEGYFASLSTLGFPMSLSWQLQQSNLRLERAMWTAKSSKTGFSVSFFWPVANHGVYSLKKSNKRRKNRRKAKVTHNLQDNNTAIPTTTSLGATTGATMSTPINANPSVRLSFTVCHHSRSLMHLTIAILRSLS